MTMGSSKKSLKHLSKAEKKVLGRYAVWQLNGKKAKSYVLFALIIATATRIASRLIKNLNDAAVIKGIA